jgi:hypothetical protein
MHHVVLDLCKCAFNEFASAIDLQKGDMDISICRKYAKRRLIPYFHKSAAEPDQRIVAPSDEDDLQMAETAGRIAGFTVGALDQVDVWQRKYASLPFPRILAYLQLELDIAKQVSRCLTIDILRDEGAEPPALLPKGFVLNDVQQSIMRALDGQAFKKEALAVACDCEPSRLYAAGIKELMDLDIVRNKPRIGYYRPDAPPPMSLDQNGTKSRPKRP